MPRSLRRTSNEEALLSKQRHASTKPTFDCLPMDAARENCSERGWSGYVPNATSAALWRSAGSWTARISMWRLAAAARVVQAQRRNRRGGGAGH